MCKGRRSVGWVERAIRRHAASIKKPITKGKSVRGPVRSKGVEWSPEMVRMLKQLHGVDLRVRSK